MNECFPWGVSMSVEGKDFGDADDGWRTRRACKDLPTSMFFSADDSFGQRRIEADAAKRICYGCPVREQCLALGWKHPYGIWGGMTPKERATARRRERNNADRQRRRMAKEAAG